MNVGILGFSGFLGTNVFECLYGINTIPGSRKLSGRFNVDATNYDSLNKWVNENRITHIINLAAECGGIGLNKTHPFKLWLSTTRISSNVLDVCVSNGINKLINVGTVCSYAAECPVPFSEDNLMHYGMPEETNRAYGLAKLNSLIGAQAAAKEFDLDVVNLIPVNMYGPHDHFDLENSHVIPAMINKINLAVINGDENVEVWGDGTPSREFLYVKDCAMAIKKALITDNVGNDPINVGTGVEVTIKDTVELIGKILGFKGKFIWNNSKPNGQIRRCLNIDKITKLLDWKPQTDFDSGLRSTISWYRNQL